MWHVSSRSGVATLRTAIHWLLTYLRVFNKSVFGLRRTLTAWHYPHSPAARRAAVRRAAIDRYLLPTGPTAANVQQRVSCCGAMVGHTDGQAPGYECLITAL